MVMLNLAVKQVAGAVDLAVNELTTIKAGKSENWGGGGSSCLSTWGLHKSLAHFVDASSEAPIMSWGMTAGNSCFPSVYGISSSSSGVRRCANAGSMFGVSTLFLLFLGGIVVGFGYSRAGLLDLL